MKRAILTIGLAVVLVCGAANAIESKSFYADGNIMPNEQWVAVRLYDTPPNHTTVNMSGGVVDWMFIYDASRLNMTDGTIYTLSSRENSLINISGGYVDSLNAYNQSIINFSGTAEAAGGAAFNSSTININGGVMDRLYVYDDGIANIYGGDIRDALYIYEDAFINIYGHHDLMKFSSDGALGYGFVQGYFNDLSWFRFEFGSSETYSHVNLIPEPTTILLFAIGGLFLRKRIK